MAILAMHRNEIFRLRELQDEFLLFLAGVSGNVNHASRIVVIHQRSAAEHVVEHAENGPFIARNDARGKNYRVIFVHGNVAVIVHGNARKGGHRLSLAAAGQNHKPLRIEAANILGPYDHAVGNANKAQRVRNLNVVNHAASNEGNLAVDPNGDVNYLLNAVNRGRKTRQDHAPRRRTAQFFDARHNSAIRRREAGPLNVGRITEKGQDAFAAVLCKSMQIKSRTIDGRLINLEISSVNDDAQRSSNRERDAIQSAVCYRNKFNFVRADLDEAAGHDFAQRCGFKEPCFFQPFFHQRQRKTRSVNRYIQITKNVRQRANVVFMPVSQHNRTNLRSVLFQIGNVRNDQVDAQKFGFGEHHAGINDDDVVTELQHHHVHAEFAEPPERDSGERVRCFTWGLAQGNIDSTM